MHAPRRYFNRYLTSFALILSTRKLLIPVFILSLSMVSSYSFAQRELSADQLYEQARDAAFQRKEYSKAIALCKQALIVSPDYADIETFLGKLYTWTQHPDSARQVFNAALKKHPENEEAYMAYGSLELWNSKPDKALDLAEAGLKVNAGNKDLLLLKARSLNDLKRYSETDQVINALLKEDPQNSEARTLAGRLGDHGVKNKVSVNYNYSHFDQQSKDPWHLASMEYSRQTQLGPVTGRVNYANRFSNSGVQLEAEAYPKISKTFYAFTQAAWSGDEGIFPSYRAGISLYANLPAAFEADAGLRYLHFSNDTWVYAAGLGKYYKNYWFNVRTYLTPGEGGIGQTYSGTVRYYYGGANDYITLGAGTGISPDDTNNILLNENYKLHSNNISAGYRRAISEVHILNLNVSLLSQQLGLTTRTTQVDFGVGYQLRF